MGVAVNVTRVPLVKFALQVAPQAIPGGSETTVPGPVLVRVRRKVRGDSRLNVAVTFRDADMVTTHGPVPLHPSPLHPAKAEPASGVAASVTFDPAAKLALQIAPQSIPGGALATVPVPVPTLATKRSCVEVP